MPLAFRVRALMQVNAATLWQLSLIFMTSVFSLPDKWLPVAIAPSDADLEVCVMDKQGIHALVFPSRKNGSQWVDASTKACIDIQPTHWRKWSEHR
jgi:hypothetical protein